MARRPAYKKIHYVRAVYNPNTKPPDSFSSLIRQALRILPTVVDTKVTIRTLGAVGVRQRHHEWNSPDQPLMIAIGAGAPGESIGTFGADATADQDEDAPESPPENRAFKLADAYLMIDEDDLLVCTDGSLRGYGSVAKYLRSLFDLAKLPPEAQAFDFEPASNEDKRRTLAQEGVKNLTLKGTLYAATNELEGGHRRGLSELWRGFRRGVQDYLAEEVTDEAERQILAAHWGDVNVTTILSPAGGRAVTPVVRSSVDDAAMDMVDEVPDDSEVIIRTRSGNTIKSGEVILTKQIALRRKERQNDLDTFEVWKELRTFRSDLIQRGAWQR
nr:hypothetical protein [uncultured Halomonas sp.]